ncbi:GNAT family N-acetyltransferase [Salinimicrobium sp. TH3]|uniref:GNAT family N-acetyltransferase n=1 Tax=Salinimicrobium sp. TH3 TaxID=2997342 RepID=UPI002272E234|nr:GNAT family N-acetyltransferase [Salinimicrobium sp. TH3]MCY2688424.1 GNAT family N-acetyltransferase [Salinimicrobium sp. TH3]
MTIFAEKKGMNLAFNKILKEEIPQILPMIQELMGHQFSNEILTQRFSEMFDQNYECFGIFHEGKPVGVFGMWFMTRHYAGRSCEPDHIFIKESYRSKGVGKKLFEFIYEYAIKKGCETSELNSYVSNYRSHKFYLNEGYEIKGYHFLKKL